MAFKVFLMWLCLALLLFFAIAIKDINLTVCFAAYYIVASVLVIVHPLKKDK